MIPSVAESLRSLRSDIDYYQAKCNSIDLDRKELTCTWAYGDKNEASASFTLPYDHLVVAAGANSNTFGIPGVKEHAMFLKEISHARRIRQRIIDCTHVLFLFDR